MILSEKNWRNAEGRSANEIEQGSLESEDRHSNLFSVDQSLRGWLTAFETRLQKKLGRAVEMSLETILA